MHCLSVAFQCFSHYLLESDSGAMAGRCGVVRFLPKSKMLKTSIADLVFIIHFLLCRDNREGDKGKEEEERGMMGGYEMWAFVNKMFSQFYLDFLFFFYFYFFTEIN